MRDLLFIFIGILLGLFFSFDAKVSYKNENEPPTTVPLPPSIRGHLTKAKKGDRPKEGSVYKEFIF